MGGNGFIVDGNPSLCESIIIGAASELDLVSGTVAVVGTELDLVSGTVAVVGIDVSDVAAILEVELSGSEEFINL